MEYTHHYESPLGGITLRSDGEALTGLRFDGQKRFEAAPPEAHEDRSLPVFAQAERWLDAYFGGKQPDFTPLLHLRASAFRVAVWEELLTIPYGQTTTYGAVAKTVAARMGLPRMSAQAVGGAVGHNPIALIIPCHRVVGADGSLTGYAGGIERKRGLLALERSCGAPGFPEFSIFAGERVEIPKNL